MLLFHLKEGNPLLRQIKYQAEQTQSVNTIIFENGNLIGHNTDIFGLIKRSNL